jgi:hypothetical protein
VSQQVEFNEAKQQMVVMAAFVQSLASERASDGQPSEMGYCDIPVLDHSLGTGTGADGSGGI